MKRNSIKIGATLLLVIIIAAVSTQAQLSQAYRATSRSLSAQTQTVQRRRLLACLVKDTSDLGPLRAASVLDSQGAL